MTFDDIYEKYGEEPDWQIVDPYDLYNLLNDNREMWEALYQEGILSQHFLYKPIRERTIRDLFFLNLFCWDSMPDGGIDEPLEKNVMTMENHSEVIKMFVKKDPTKTVAKQSEMKSRLILL